MRSPMDDKTTAHRLSLLKAGHRRWKLRVAEERFVEVSRCNTVAFSALGTEVFA